MAAQTADSFQKIKRESTPRTQEFVGTLAHTYLVDQLETKDSSSNGPVIPASAQAENDDSDEDKDADGVNIEAEAPGGELTPGCGRDKWLTLRSCKEEEKAEAQEEERGGQWEQNTDHASKSPCIGSIPKRSVS